jgi:two-component system response regulator MprA
MKRKKNSEVLVDQKTILVVDDSSCFRTLMMHVLDFMGYEVVTAEDGADAIEKLADMRPTMVLMDVEMPELGGLAACRRIKGNPMTAAIPILMVSGNPDAAISAIDAGADDFLAKPFSLDTLTSRLRTIVEQKAPLAAAARTA